MTQPRMLPCGPRAVLFEYDSLDDVMGVVSALDPSAWPSLIEVVPAARTVLVVHDGSGVPDGVLALLSHPPEHVPKTGGHVEIDVEYDGIDLSDVAARCGMSVTEVVRLHSSVEYRVAFCGFVPGFSYLVGLPARLVLPRRPTPRPAVSAGSVAIASEYSAVYPSPSPGGWHLLGQTSAVLWDESREPPALLPPGTTVRFRPA